MQEPGPIELGTLGGSSEDLEQLLGWGQWTKDGQKVVAGREEAQAAFGFLLVLGQRHDSQQEALTPGSRLGSEAE